MLERLRQNKNIADIHTAQFTDHLVNYLRSSGAERVAEMAGSPHIDHLTFTVPDLDKYSPEMKQLLDGSNFACAFPYFDNPRVSVRLSQKINIGIYGETDWLHVYEEPDSEEIRLKHALYHCPRVEELAISLHQQGIDHAVEVEPNRRILTPTFGPNDQRVIVSELFLGQTTAEALNAGVAIDLDRYIPSRDDTRRIA